MMKLDGTMTTAASGEVTTGVQSEEQAAQRVSPFIHGARVAVEDRWGGALSEAFVDKVRKNGNFTLAGSPQQWRPWASPYGTSTWRATETGKGYQQRTLTIWDATTDAELREKAGRADRAKRFKNVLRLLDRRRPETVTEEMLSAIEAALAVKATGTEPANRDA